MSFLLEAKNIYKSFGGTHALKGANFNLLKGEIHSLLGENGAGKSTLIKILAGVHKKDSGQIFINGKLVDFSNPKDAKDFGVSTVFQELSLCPNLSIAENIFVNRVPSTCGLINNKSLFEKTKKHLHDFQIDLKPQTLVKDLNLGQRQLIEIIKAISLDSKILILDEPTSALEITEARTLFTLIHKLKESGAGIIFVSHKLDEVFEISNRITVFRDGEFVATKLKEETTQDEIITFMAGRKIERDFTKHTGRADQEILSINNYSLQNKFSNINFKLFKGEILGFAGLNGAGRSETIQSIIGYLPKDSGSIIFEGKKINIFNPTDAIEKGIIYSPEDRKEQGLFLNQSVVFNTVSMSLKSCSGLFFMNSNEEKKLTNEFIEKFSIKVQNLSQSADSLSGGNQQKILLSKCLAVKPKLLIVDEPTRGIDIFSKIEIHKILQDYVSQGGSIILISSDMPELINLSSRIIVFKEGKTIGELKENISENSIMNLIFKYSEN